MTLLLSERTRGVKESASESSWRLKAEARCASEHTGLQLNGDGCGSLRHFYTKVLQKMHTAKEEGYSQNVKRVRYDP